MEFKTWIYKGKFIITKPYNDDYLGHGLRIINKYVDEDGDQIIAISRSNERLISLDGNKLLNILYGINSQEEK